MKELENHLPDKVKLLAEIPIKRESKLLGSTRRIPGLTLFEFNTRTKELTPATFDNVLAIFKPGHALVGTKREVNVRADCLYLQALNLTNAKRKLGIP